MPTFTVTTTARATITEHWRVEAETEAQARDYHEWPNGRFILARDLIEGDEGEREVTFCVADGGKGAAEQEAIRRTEDAAPAMLAALQKIARDCMALANDPVMHDRAYFYNVARDAEKAVSAATVTPNGEADPETLYRIDYECPDCGHEWQEEWSCACDSECPQCGARDIEASHWEEIEE